MTELVLETNTLPEPLIRLIHAEKVKVRKAHGEVRLTPVTPAKEYCPFWGMLTDGRLTSEKFMADKRLEKELERSPLRKPLFPAGRC
jgi:hypothetical protein